MKLFNRILRPFLRRTWKARGADRETAPDHRLGGSYSTLEVLAKRSSSEECATSRARISQIYSQMRVTLFDINEEAPALSTTPKTTTIGVQKRPIPVNSDSPAPRLASTSFRPYSKQDERLRGHSSASMGSGAGRARAFTGRRRKSGTWSPSPITGASTSRRGRSRRGAGSANREGRGGEARS